ncbi:MAG TPA: hypothetical protein VEB21_05130 [Terriglobales bacterium]|nr:hypothetical protein [Terriglobales bacterium]
MSSQKKYGEDAGQRYDEKVEKFAQSDKGERAAEEARRDVDTPQGQKQYDDAVDRGRLRKTDRER